MEEQATANTLPQSPVSGQSHPVGPDIAPESTLHLVDFENLCGGPRRLMRCGRAVWDEYVWLLGREDDIRVAVSPCVSAETSRIVGAAAAVETLGGENGADLCLLKAKPESIALRYGRVVIGSGDGIFTTLARQLRHVGVAVDVVTGFGRLASSLYKAADNHIALDSVKVV